MGHFYSVHKVAGGGICLAFLIDPFAVTSSFLSPRRQLWAETGSQSRLSSGQVWQTGDDPPTALYWKYIISFLISSLLHPCRPPPPLLHLNFKWKAFHGVQTNTSPSLETGPWFLLESGIPPSIHFCWPCLFVGTGCSDANVRHFWQPWGLLAQTKKPKLSKAC